MSWQWYAFGEHMPPYTVLDDRWIADEPHGQIFDRYIKERRGLAGGRSHTGWQGEETIVRIRRPYGELPGSPHEKILRR